MKHKTKSKQIRHNPSCNKSYIGYCHSTKHKGYITEEILKEHQCINQKYTDEEGKESYRVCPRLEKFEDKPYWKKKERAKMMRRLQKEAAEHNISADVLNKTAEKYAYNENLIRVMLYLPINRR